MPHFRHRVSKQRKSLLFKAGLAILLLYSMVMIISLQRKRDGLKKNEEETKTPPSDSFTQKNGEQPKVLPRGGKEGHDDVQVGVGVFSNEPPEGHIKDQLQRNVGEIPAEANKNAERNTEDEEEEKGKRRNIRERGPKKNHGGIVYHQPMEKELSDWQKQFHQYTLSSISTSAIIRDAHRGGVVGPSALHGLIIQLVSAYTQLPLRFVLVNETNPQFTSYSFDGKKKQVQSQKYLSSLFVLNADQKKFPGFALRNLASGTYLSHELDGTIALDRPWARGFEHWDFRRAGPHETVSISPAVHNLMDAASTAGEEVIAVSNPHSFKLHVKRKLTPQMLAHFHCRVVGKVQFEESEQADGHIKESEQADGHIKGREQADGHIKQREEGDMDDDVGSPQQQADDFFSEQCPPIYLTATIKPFSSIKNNGDEEQEGGGDILQQLLVLLNWANLGPTVHVIMCWGSQEEITQTKNAISNYLSSVQYRSEEMKHFVSSVLFRDSEDLVDRNEGEQKKDSSSAKRLFKKSAKFSHFSDCEMHPTFHIPTYRGLFQKAQEIAEKVHPTKLGEGEGRIGSSQLRYLLMYTNGDILFEKGTFFASLHATVGMYYRLPSLGEEARRGEGLYGWKRDQPVGRLNDQPKEGSGPTDDDDEGNVGTEGKLPKDHQRRRKGQERRDGHVERLVQHLLITGRRRNCEAVQNAQQVLLMLSDQDEDENEDDGGSRRHAPKESVAKIGCHPLLQYPALYDPRINRISKNSEKLRNRKNTDDNKGKCKSTSSISSFFSSLEDDSSHQLGCPLFGEDAQDYFIVTPHFMQWKEAALLSAKKKHTKKDVDLTQTSGGRKRDLRIKERQKLHNESGEENRKEEVFTAGDEGSLYHTAHFSTRQKHHEKIVQRAEEIVQKIHHQQSRRNQRSQKADRPPHFSSSSSSTTSGGHRQLLSVLDDGIASIDQKENENENEKKGERDTTDPRSPSSSPLHQIPPLVVGGIAFDNWFVSQANKRRDTVVVDASHSLVAIHLPPAAKQKKDGKGKLLFASHRKKQSEYNSKMAHEHGGWARGKVSLAAFASLLLPHATPWISPQQDDGKNQKGKMSGRWIKVSLDMPFSLFGKSKATTKGETSSELLFENNDEEIGEMRRLPKVVIYERHVAMCPRYQQTTSSSSTTGLMIAEWEMSKALYDKKQSLLSQLSEKEEVSKKRKKTSMKSSSQQIDDDDVDDDKEKIKKRKWFEILNSLISKENHPFYLNYVQGDHQCYIHHYNQELEHREGPDAFSKPWVRAD